MKILLTGASGFIGRYLMEGWSSGEEVYALVHHPRPEWRRKNFTLIETDLNGALAENRLPARVDVIMHLARSKAVSAESAKEILTVNALATRQLLDYARRAKAKRFIYISTGDVYGYRLGPCRESDPPHPLGLYAASKFAGELMVHAYSNWFQTCVVRLFRPYGPGQMMPRLIPRLAQSMLEGRSVFVAEDEGPFVSPIFIEDVVEIFNFLLRSSFTGTINVGGEETVSMKSLIEKIAALWAVKPQIEIRRERSGDQIGDIALLKQLLPSRPFIRLDEGLYRTFPLREKSACLSR